MIKHISEYEPGNQLLKIPMADVRTPAEFAQGHIPGAFNLPLFSNEERIRVGTTYKQVGREAAILLGFEITGNKWPGFIRQALESAPEKKIAVHCWRGGMRSGAMAWALDLYGFDVYLLDGGYKRFRNWVLRQFELSYPLLVLGGMTGSGKTRILRQLSRENEQIIDLEELAQHQGSAYGSMNRLVQPTQEQFENELAWQLNQLDKRRTIWIEDESISIGRCVLPKPFWKQLGDAPLVNIEVPAAQRILSLLAEYGALDRDFLIACTQRIRKRLGFAQAQQAIAAIQEDRLEDFIRLIIVYYDRTYLTCMSKRNSARIYPIPLSDDNAAGMADKIIKQAALIEASAAID